ncbi:protein kinase domain-containing protein, partial [Nocardioides dubius]
MNSGPERDTDDPLIGRLLDGRYRIGDRIARGGMAGVYEAVDVRLDRTVAVKVMHPGLGDDGDFAERFVREAKHAARLSHPNVVAVYDQGEERGTVFLVMEYVPGHTLRDVIRQQAPMPPLKALSLIEPVLAALAAAHQAGLIHRDIKPENVLIPDAPGGVPKVADFGLAKAISADTQHTATGGVLIGTVSYLAPELVVDGRADTRADVYAAGVVLFELLTGKKPHEGESPIQVAYKHVHEDVPPPSSIVTSTEPELRIPAYLDALVARATARDREHRAADARVLLHQVRRVRQALADGVLDDPELVADLAPPAVTAQQEAQFHEDTTPDPLGSQRPAAATTTAVAAAVAADPARAHVEATTTFDRS